MGYIKYSWVRGKHTVQYPELKHVIHTEINNLPGPRPGLHSLRMRFWYASSSCRRQESWVKKLVTTGTHLKTWSSADIGTKVAVFQPLNLAFHDPAGEEPKQVTENLKTRSNDQSEKHKHGLCVATWLLINEKRRRVSAHKVARWHKHTDEPFYSPACQLMGPSSPHFPHLNPL